jgi:CelD/BcsL family acetyltransferase involved in cellulose biosynthesis
MMSNIKRITRLEEFSEIKKDWNKLLFSSKQNTIFLIHEWFASWWKAFSENRTLEVLVIKEKDGSLFGAAPMMSDENGLSFIASREVTDYCDFIFRDGRGEEFFKELLSHFCSNYTKGTQFRFVNIPSSSPSLSLLPRIAPSFDISVSLEISEVCPLVELPSTYEMYISGLKRKYRHELRRKLRRTESLGDLKIKKIIDTAELEEIIPQFIDLHRKSSVEKERFWENEGMTVFFTEVIFQFSLNKWVEMFCLYHKEELLAVLISFVFNDDISFYNVAFRSKYTAYNPGIYLFDQALKDAIAKGMKRADFLRGDEKYKYNFGAEECKIYDLLLLIGGSAE